ncbi:MAG: T9SS type A sorting domain-containing protein [Bacteroidetes bacterium]|nr:T9SS type A sorting domain-containing protein [Bacteroidota bacterium]
MRNYKRYSILIIMLISCNILGQQLNITQVEKMPNKPEPYLMRDWKQTAIGYDSYVFNFQASGQYLPLISINTNTVNYKNHNSFKLHTVVGTNSPGSAEAINCLPAVIGASLVGIDKSNKDGNNYVLMCEEWFNKRPEQNVYKNHPVDDTADDWWYETMPNVFFYQLYSLYPSTGDFDNQLISVADQWLKAVVKMGGSSTPWKIPYMNYRGWDLATMLPFPSGVAEPEAAGAIGWILYNAFVETGNEKYRLGAEWCMEYLNSLTSNPSYELQLPYGVYAAARMNSELGTDYDIPKLLNWCFNVGSLRNWGIIVGRWGKYDVNGLVGEVNGNNDYPFSMNTFEHIGALVPLVRYDDRYARAIGKWVLNAANSSRLFYTKYLPDNHQDSEEWAHQYDPDSYLAHEAIRQELYGARPYATGDAIAGGWGKTNLTLYSSSHVGILGGIIDTTDVPMILKLDLLKTDYFNKNSFPSFLIFNPYEVQKTITFPVGNGNYDIYDAVTNSFLKNSVSGETSISIPPDAAVIAVLVPSGGNLTYERNRTLLNGVVVDFNNGMQVSNYPPRIKSLSSDKNILLQGQSANLYCTAFDKENSTLSYIWNTDGGSISGEGAHIVWQTPNQYGEYKIRCIVDDGKGGKDTATVQVQVVNRINNAPIINKINAEPRKLDINSETNLICFATDPDNDSLTYNWNSASGSFTGEGSRIIWMAPDIEGNYIIKCIVTDEYDAASEDSIEIMVRDFSSVQTGNLITFYPFNGNANDISGNNFNGTVNGAQLVSDRFNNSSSAYLFNGVNNSIVVPNNDILNFQNAITVSFWIQVDQFYDREAYPLSHGNWENRWKISITNKHVRWTLKTNTGIKDLDSETELEKGKLYHVVAEYSGKDFELYLNGKLDAFSSHLGAISKTSINLTIGQVLPNNNQYNFKGVLDDIRIYDYALPFQSIVELYDFPTSVEDDIKTQIPDVSMLCQNYPNPFNPVTTIQYQIPAVRDAVSGLKVTLKIYDMLGTEIATLVDGFKAAGYYKIDFNAAGLSSGVYFYTLKAGDYINTKKFVLLK